MSSVVHILRESWATARALRGFSLTVAAIGFAVIAGLTVTVGQGVAQRDAVAATFTQPHLRTLTLVDEEGSRVLPWSMLADVRSLSTVDEVWMTGPAVDVRNRALADGPAVAARAVADSWEGLPLTLRQGRWPSGPDEAVIDSASATALGFRDGIGAVQDANGREWAVVGVYDPDHQRAPTGALFEADVDRDEPRNLYVTVTHVQSMEQTTAMLLALSESSRPGQIRVEQATDLAQLRAGITGTVSERSATIVAGVMTAGALVLGLVSVLMVNSRRQEFGRRRALGASRLTVVALVLLPGWIVMFAGSVCGAICAAGYLWFAQSVVVPPDFVVWTVVAASLGGAIAQLPSAAAAGLRDPVRVLRMP